MNIFLLHSYFYSGFIKFHLNYVIIKTNYFLTPRAVIVAGLFLLRHRASFPTLRTATPPTISLAELGHWRRRITRLGCHRTSAKDCSWRFRWTPLFVQIRLARDRMAIGSRLAWTTSVLISLLLISFKHITGNYCNFLCSYIFGV